MADEYTARRDALQLAINHNARFGGTDVLDLARDFLGFLQGETEQEQPANGDDDETPA